MEYVEIRLRDVKPNPYRNVADHPLHEDRVEALAESIEDTGFWANIVGRINENDDFEMAYGHHRLQAAINVLGEDYIQSFPVSDLPDHLMLEMMVRENSENWNCTTELNNLAVARARDYLDDLLTLYPTWEEALASVEIGRKVEHWFDGAASYASAVDKGAGRNTIRQFLGESTVADIDIRRALHLLGPSKKQTAAALATAKAAEKDAKRARAEAAKQEADKIAATNKRDKEAAEQRQKKAEDAATKAESLREKALKRVADADKIDIKAAEVFDNPAHASAFISTVTSERFGDSMPKENQLAFAKEVKAKIKKDAREETTEAIKQVCVASHEKHIKEVTREDLVKHYAKTANTMKNHASRLSTLLVQMRKDMKEDGIVTLEGSAGAELYESLSNLHCSIASFYDHFEIETPMLVERESRDGRRYFSIKSELTPRTSFN